MDEKRSKMVPNWPTTIIVFVMVISLFIPNTQGIIFLIGILLLLTIGLIKPGIILKTFSFNARIISFISGMSPEELLKNKSYLIRSRVFYGIMIILGLFILLGILTGRLQG